MSKKANALGILVAIYVIVSVIAYTDFPRRDPQTVLTNQEQRGFAVWRRNNCQVCHQIYGFGGFLGPDLTNRIDDTTPDDAFGQILTGGLGKMPALHLELADQRAVLAYLRAVNRTGRSQPRPIGANAGPDPQTQYEHMLTEWTPSTRQHLDSSVRHGFDVWTRNRCSTCHVPFTLGLNRAPDISAKAMDRSMDGLTSVLAGEKAKMPSFALTPEEIHDLRAFLEFLTQQRVALININDHLREREAFSLSAVPGFEYK